MERKYPRARWHDYNCGIYFVTVCTHGRSMSLGTISNHAIELTPIGHFLHTCIEEIPRHDPDVQIDTFVVMPNHFHAIIVVGSRHAAASQAQPDIGCLKPPRHPDKSDNFNRRTHHNARLSKVIGGVKSATTRFAKNYNAAFSWQPNFHDHIIRTHEAYVMICDYIANNVKRWDKDCFNPNSGQPI